MAEAIGLASGILTLSSFAFKASITLHQTVQSYKFHPKRVRDLNEELEALGSVLNSLTETVGNSSDVDLSALDLPLLRCGNACTDFEKEIVRCSSRTEGGRTSFRDWAKLRYMGDDIASFTQQLAGYKATINIALTDATLRRSSITAESLEVYRQLLKTANDDVEAHLLNMDEKLKTILEHAVKEPRSNIQELRQIQDERMSAQKCLEICAKLSKHIDEIQLTFRRGSSNDEASSRDTVPEKVTDEGLQECRNTLTDTAAKLEKYAKNRLDQLVTQASEGMTKEDSAELARVREEWETARQCLDIYTRADFRLKENVSTIENYATGDAVQFMVSTDGKTIHGKNRGLGWRSRQVGGHLSDITVQQLSRDMSGIIVRNQEGEALSTIPKSREVEDIPVSEFSERYGQGFKLFPRVPDA